MIKVDVLIAMPLEALKERTKTLELESKVLNDVDSFYVSQKLHLILTYQWIQALKSLSVAVLIMLSYMEKLTLESLFFQHISGLFGITRMLKSLYWKYQEIWQRNLNQQCYLSWNDIQKYFSSNKVLLNVFTFKLKSLLAKHFLGTYNNSQQIRYLHPIFILAECNFSFITFFLYYL